MAPWLQYRGLPDANGVHQAAPVWSAEVARLLPLLGDVSDASAAQAGSGRVALDGMVLREQARVANLLTRIPDEIAGQLFDLMDNAQRAGQSTERIAAQVDAFLQTSGSDRWPNRAMVIARTETARAWNVGWLAANMQVRPGASKTWDTDLDGRERPAHHAANGQTVPLGMPFQVGDEYLMYPTDVTGSPENVIECRCSMTIRAGG
jgi:uncharacterized protein with gpF-like domain